jgi:hypothetical protein
MASSLPACTGTAKTDTAAGECLIANPGNALGYFGVATMAFDAKGNFYFATDDQNPNTNGYSIWKCSHSCLYTATTPPSPIQVWAEPISATPSTTGQLFIGPISFDPWGNLFFTDNAQTNSNGTEASSYVKEMAVDATANSGFGGITTGFVAAPTTVASYSDGTPAQYDDQIASLYIDPALGTVYFGLGNSGIWALPNTKTGGVNTAGLYGVTSRGAKLLAADSTGNLYFVAYNSGDTLGYISFGGPTFPGTASALTADVTVADNTANCTPTLTFTFASSEYSATPTGCAGIGEVTQGSSATGSTGSFNAVTVTFAPAGGATVAPPSGLTVNDGAASSGTLTAKGSIVSGIDQTTWLSPFAAGGVFAASSQGSSGAVNKEGVIVMGSSYGGYIQEFTAGGTVVAEMGGKFQNPGGVAIDSNDFLFASDEVSYDGTLASNTILKFPVILDPGKADNGTYPPVPASDTLIEALPTCQGDASDAGGICQITLGGPNVYFGVTAMALDAAGNLFYTTSGAPLASGSTLTFEGYSVYECPLSCLYGATPTNPVLIYTEPAADAAGDQLYLGGIAVDSNENVFFTDNDVAGSGSSYGYYSDLYEAKPTPTGYAAPILLETLKPICTVASAPCTYNNELDGVSVDAKGDLFFADQYTGIYELVNNSGSFNVEDVLPIAAPGAKVIFSDNNGNFYFAGYHSGGDTLGWDQIGGVNIAGQSSAATPGTASFSVLSNYNCGGNPSLTFAFSGVSSGLDTDFAAPSPTGCGAMAVGGGSSYSSTITYTPSASAGGNITATLTATDVTNGGSDSATVTALAGTPQVVTIGGITSPVTYGGGPYTLTTTGGASGNPVVLTIDGTFGGPTGGAAIASLNGDVLTITGVGQFQIDANQAGGTSGSTTYSAGSATLQITVTQASQTITPPTLPASMPYGTSITLPTAVGGGSGNPVVYTIDASSTAGAGTLTGSSLMASGIGTIVLDLNQTGNADYTAATQVQASIAVVQAAQTITISANPTTATYPATSAITATGGASGNPVTLAITTGGTIATLSGTTLTPTGTAFGAVTVTANQAGNTDYTAAAAGTVTVTFNSEGTVATPTFSPAAGTYYGTTTAVAISTTTAGATIWYTTDGSNPGTSETAVKYTAPIALATPQTTTINAIAEETGYVNSAIGTSAYVISSIPPTFGLSLSPSYAIFGPGQTSASITVTMIPNAQLPASIALSCSGLPSGATCSFSPATVPTAGTGTTTLTSTLTVTDSSTSASLRHDSSPLFPGATLAVALCLFGFRKRRRLQMILLLAVSIIGLSLFTGCGGSSTPLPTATVVTVTGVSGTVTETANLTVVVEK